MGTSGNKTVIGQAIQRLKVTGSMLKPFAAGASVASMMALSTTALGYNYAQEPLFWSMGVKPNVMLMLDDSGSMTALVTNESFQKALDAREFNTGGAQENNKWYFCTSWDATGQQCNAKSSSPISTFTVKAWNPGSSTTALSDYISTGGGGGGGSNYALCNVSKKNTDTGFYVGNEGSTTTVTKPTTDTIGVLVSDKSSSKSGRTVCVHWRQATTQSSYSSTTTVSNRDGTATEYDINHYAQHLLNKLAPPSTETDRSKYSLNLGNTAAAYTAYPYSDSDPDVFTAATDDKIIPAVSRIEAAREVANQVILDNYLNMQIGLASFRSSGSSTWTGEIDLGCDATKTSGVFDVEGQKTALLGSNTDMNNMPTAAYDSAGKVDMLDAKHRTPLAKTMNVINTYFDGTTSPITYRCQQNFAVLMTDGDPTEDSNTLDYRAQQAYDTDFKTYATDANDAAGKSWDTTENDGDWTKQNLVTYTIGFGLENDLLKQTPLVDRKTITRTTVTNNTITLANHGLKTGDMIEVVSGATLNPAAAASSGDSEAGKYYYYVAKMSDSTFKLATTKLKATNCSGGTTADCSTIKASADVVLSIGPGKSYFAFTPEGLAQSLNAAFSEIRNLTASSSAVAASSKQVASALVYQANFSTEDWSGKVRAYNVNPSTGMPTSQAWSTEATLDSASERATNIFTWNDSALPSAAAVSFSYANLSNNQRSIISNKATGTSYPTGDSTVGGNAVNWIKGQDVTAGGFRSQAGTGRIGDVINADPIFVGTGNYGYNKLPASPAPTDSPSCTVSGTTSTGSGCTGAETYAAFVTGNAARTPMLYVGANDGVLHGLNGNTGAEVLAYVPAGVYEQWNDKNNNNVKDAGETENKLFNVTQNSYLGIGKHRFLLDGSAVVGDAFIGNNWKTYLVSGLGAGGRSYFALDVTNPSAFTTSVAANTVVKWEFMNENLGYSFGKPVIGRLGNNKWYAFFPNGTDSRYDKAGFFAVNLNDVTDYKWIPVTDGASALSPNGMMVIQARINSQRTVTALYGGDMKGNIWKVDLSGITSASSTFPTGVTSPLFTAGDGTTGTPQAITGGIRLGQYPNSSNTLVYFGTGKYFETDDKTFVSSGAKPSVPQVDSFYGVLDDGTTGITRGNLTAQTFTVGATTGTRVASENNVTYSGSNKGWYIDLIVGSAKEGERVITQPLLYGSRIIFVSMIPAATDPCTATGTSWLNELDALTGKNLDEGVLDTNGDATIDTTDKVASLKIDGMASEPTIITTGTGKDFKVMGSTSQGAPIQAVAEKTPPGAGLPGGAGRMSWMQLQ